MSDYDTGLPVPSLVSRLATSKGVFFSRVCANTTLSSYRGARENFGWRNNKDFKYPCQLVGVFIINVPSLKYTNRLRTGLWARHGDERLSPLDVRSWGKRIKGPRLHGATWDPVWRIKDRNVLENKHASNLNRQEESETMVTVQAWGSSIPSGDNSAWTGPYLQ